MAEDREFDIGVIGVGHLIRHLAPAFLRAQPRPRMLLSPRGSATAEDLRSRLGLTVAATNSEVVTGSRIVIVAVRPFQVAEALDGLPWRPGQLVLSLCAGVGLATLQGLVPNCTVVRAMPVVAGEYGESPTTLFPDHDDARRVLAPAGPVIALPDEDTFEAASVFGAAYGWVQALGADLARWLEVRGVPAEAARLLAYQTIRAGATTPLERRDTPADELVNELCLPGSITGFGLEHLAREDAFGAWHRTADAVLDKLRDPGND